MTTPSRFRRAGRGTPMVLFLTSALIGSAFVAGCGSSGNGTTAPNGVAVTMAESQVQLARTVSAQAALTYPYREDAFNWYVNDILGGNSMSGTITQTNPATYTAPPAVPAAGEIVVKAVSQSDTTLWAADTLAVLFTIKHVDRLNGNDAAGGGAWNNPLKTITYTLQQAAEEGDTVLVHPGTYNAALGEDDYITPGQDVTLRGVSADSCILEIEGYVNPADGATFESFTMAVPMGEDPNYAIHTYADCTVRDIHTTYSYDRSAIKLIGGTQLVEDCEIINTSGVIDDRGMELVDGTHVTVRNCTFTGWSYGIFVNNESDPLIEGCTFSGNMDGVNNNGGTGMTSEPDLGGGARGSLGGNTFTGNTQAGVLNRTASFIWALYNTWDNTPPVEGPPYPCDIENTGGGTVITQAP